VISRASEARTQTEKIPKTPTATFFRPAPGVFGIKLENWPHDSELFLGPAAKIAPNPRHVSG
jgi:hypothetical protein